MEKKVVTMPLLSDEEAVRLFPCKREDEYQFCRHTKLHNYRCSDCHREVQRQADAKDELEWLSKLMHDSSLSWKDKADMMIEREKALHLISEGKE